MIPGLKTVDVDEFLGQLDALDFRDCPKEYSPDCPNCAFEPGAVFTRPATIARVDWGSGVTNVLDMKVLLWSTRKYLGLVVTGSGTEFAYFNEGAGARTTLISAGTLSQSATVFRYAIYGNLCFLVFSTGSVGLAVPYVWNLTTDTVDEPTVAAPDTSGTSAADGGTGDVDEGVHKIIIIAVSRTGYESEPGEDYVTYTATAGDKISVTGIPATTSVITSYIVGMTAADLLDYYQVGTTTSTSFTIDISDDQLVNQRSLDAHFRHMHPLKSFLNVFEYNNRLVWVAPSDEASICWISQAGLPLCILDDTGFLPFGREDGDRCTAAFGIRKALYVTKTRAIWATQDTGGEPATWLKPYPVCKWAGTVSPNGVTQTSDKDEALILDIKGPLRFLGGDPVNVSQNISGTFDRLAYGTAMGRAQIAVDPLESRVFAFVPLDGASLPGTLLVGDYKEGWNRIKWSPWTTAGTAWRSIAVDSAEVLIQEAGRHLCRFGDHSNDGLPSNPPEDDRDGTAINSYYVTGKIEPKKAGIHNLHEVTMTGRGLGNLDLEVRGGGNTALTPSLSPIAMIDAQTQDMIRGMNYSQERWFFKFGTNGTGERFRISSAIFSVTYEGVRPRLV